MSAAPVRQAETPIRNMADMPVQLPAAPTGPAEARARFFNSGNAFNIKMPPVPARLFTEEPARLSRPTPRPASLPVTSRTRLAAPFRPQRP